MLLSDVCLSVCLAVAYIGPKLRTERPRKTKIGTEIAHVTRKAAAAVSVGPYSAWESTATLRLLGGARGAWAPTGDEREAGHIVSPRAQLVHNRRRPHEYWNQSLTNRYWNAVGFGFHTISHRGAALAHHHANTPSSVSTQRPTPTEPCDPDASAISSRSAIYRQPTIAQLSIHRRRKCATRTPNISWHVI